MISPVIPLDIFHDPICPWCAIGKARLDRALEARPDHPFALQWHPFQLNPTMPKGGMERQAYLNAKFGGAERARKAYLPIIEVMLKEMPKVDLLAIKTTPNTLDAHRLIHWAGIEGRQTPMVSALYRAYFQEGRDIGDVETLVALAERVEMDGAAVRRLLLSDADVEDIQTRDTHARERGVNAVPLYIVANQHAVEGAQPPELWMRVNDELTAQIAADDQNADDQDDDPSQALV
ncbi:Predicted dithiol-disulfide isomerase, DsbA family [Celeribacter baekdonensis]|uniref:Predicted dithiol-disulfide isomerase, DsbA family n=1 Tax=Celeribacter baekdonensis TaxID=875171 RepID=A0A1G7FBY2_9RHOB|nr:DsbA family oxidoreductase [Celeribacter baekdonensis]SDE73489.1 Predicted dithiol-disulfide isomerase, DsbA family [Celeribacter baekdonensis]